MRLERKDRSNVPAGNFMSQADSDFIVEKVTRLALMSMSSKDPSAVNCAHGTFRYLCWLSPAKTVPVILPQIYSALESFTQVQSTDYRHTGQYHLSVV
jgi:Proteasome-substrate-size regulator, mid region